ncbi:hypothetical protein BLA28_30985 [Eisenbergiella tayi]|nr:GNAT family protein [Eisenbergiella tayi]OIZ59710.1 hypothetical protein BLA28_30985 [Eisenbergiella tayi]
MENNIVIRRMQETDPQIFSDEECAQDWHASPEKYDISCKKNDRTKIGTCGFHCWNKEKSSAEVGYDLKEAFWGNDHMQEALKEIIAFAAKSMNIKRIDAVIYVENPKSISVVERLGFSFDGKIKNEIFRDSEYLHRIYSIYCTK